MTKDVKPAPAGVGGWLLSWAKTIVIALTVWFVVSSFLFKAFRITSSSMENTLLVGDVLFVNKLLYGPRIPLTRARLPAMRKPKLGSIVVFESVETPDLTVVKRVVGMAGDTLAMQNGILTRNGTAIEEPWVPAGPRLMPSDPAGDAQIRRWQVRYLAGGDTAAYHPTPNDWGPIVVPAETYFVMGDNRSESYDGRYWGFLPQSNVEGSPIIVYYSYNPDTYRPLPIISNVRWGRIFTIPR